MERRGYQETVRQCSWQPGPGGGVVQMARSCTGDTFQHGCRDWKRVDILPDEANSWPVLRRTRVSGAEGSFPVHQLNQLIVRDPGIIVFISIQMKYLTGVRYQVLTALSMNMAIS